MLIKTLQVLLLISFLLLSGCTDASNTPEPTINLTSTPLVQNPPTITPPATSTPAISISAVSSVTVGERTPASSELTAIATPSNSPIPTKVSSANSGVSLKQLYTTKSLTGHTQAIRSLAFSPDGKTFASGSADNSIILRSVSSGKAIATLKGHTDTVLALAFSPDGKLLTSSGYDYTARVWSLETNQLIKTFPITRYYGGWIPELGFSLDGKLLLTEPPDDSTFDTTLRTVADWQPFSLTFHADDISGYDSFDPVTNDPTIVQVNKGQVKVLSLATGQVLNSFAINTEIMGLLHCSSLVFSPDRSLFAIAAIPPNNNILIWSLQTGKEVAAIPIGSKDPAYLTISPNNQFFAFVSDRRTVEVWSLTNKQKVNTFNSASDVLALTFDKTSQQLIWGDDTGSLTSQAVNSAKVNWQIRGQNKLTNDVAFSPNGRMLASAKSDGTIQITSVPDGKEFKVIQAHANGANTVAFSPDGKTLATGGQESIIKLWSLDTGQLTKQIKVEAEDVTQLKFSPDGQLLLSMGTKPYTQLQLWSVSDGKLVSGVHGSGDYCVRTAAFSGDNNLLGIESSDGEYHDPGLHLWKLQEAKQADELEPFYGGITLGEKDWTTALAFSSDSKLLASAYEPGVPSKFDYKSDNTAGFEIWSTVDTAIRLVQVDGISDYINWLAFSPDNKILFSTGRDRVIRIWNTQNGQELFHTNLNQTYGLKSAALSSNGKYIATSHFDGSVKLWEVIVK